MAEAAAETLTATTEAAPATTEQQTTVVTAAPEANAEAPATESTAEKPAGAEASNVIEYDFQFQEGIEVNQTALEQASAIFKEANLPQEQAQKLVDLFTDQVTQGEAAHEAYIETMKTQWLDELQADEELGGTNLDKNAALSLKAMNRFGSAGLREILNKSGFGNHPEMVRFAARIGAAISEDNHVGGAPAFGKKGHAETLYPDSN